MMLLTQTDTTMYRRMISQYPQYFGYLVTPRKYSCPHFISKQIAPWAADNDAFNRKFDADVFFPWLESLHEFRDFCIFVTIPDTVGDAKKTLSQFAYWSPRVQSMKYPVALALQDGMQASDIPWKDIKAVFLGGSTEWKLSHDALRLIIEARCHDKWVHIGRVNSQRRVRHFWDYADSFDGRGFAIAPDAKLAKFLPLFRMLDKQRRLSYFT